MQVQLETLSGLERRVSIALPLEAINVKVNEKLKRVARTAKIQGFRPGKAPLKLVSANYGASIRDEVLSEEINSSFSEFVTQNALRVASQLNVEHMDFDEENFKFKALFEVFPEITFADLTTLEIEKPVTPVTDVEIEKTIDVLRQQRTSFHYVERAAQTGDRVIIDFKGSLDGVPFEGGSAENFPFVLGQNQMLNDFEAGVMGMKEGEVKVIDVTFPEDYQAEEIKGKTAAFEITLKSVAEPKMPEIDAAFATALGVPGGDVDAMRADIKKNVEREVKRRLDNQTKANVMQALYDASTLELPKSLISVEVKELMAQTLDNFAKRGMATKGVQLPEELFLDQAKRRVALGLILPEMITMHKLETNMEQVTKLIQEFAESYEDPAQVVEHYMSSPELLSGPFNSATEQNVVDFVLSQAKVVEKPVAFDTLMSQEA